MDSRAGRRGAVADAKVVAGVAHRTRRFGRPTALTFAAHEQRQVQARNGMATEVGKCAGRSRRRLPGASRTGVIFVTRRRAQCRPERSEGTRFGAKGCIVILPKAKDLAPGPRYIAKKRKTTRRRRES